MLTNFENKLNEINSAMIFLGDKIIAANEVILEALKSKDYTNFSNAKVSLANIREEAHDIDVNIVSTLALFAPEARDLKSMVSYLKITNEYIRASSNTRSFLKNFPTKTDGELHLEKLMPNIILLQKSCVQALKFAIEMIREPDENIVKDLCVKVNIEEAKADDIYSIIEKDLFVEMLNAKELSQEYFQTLSLIRKLEKITDRATSIANLQYNGCNESNW
ncbi:MAG: PhoU domain-containing protein [Sulfurovaceae bacterium]|nr:PhoU domain-containing protein [Sulfurovaceae bacterium]MDD5548537.1 PhoU domain-containing protein [Sulfurovaceae bacterium]